MILQGNSLDVLKSLNNETVDCCITSPPYYALRDYKVDGQIGLEKTFQEYLDKLIQIFIEVKRVLKKTGTCWVVMGDTYSNNNSFGNDNSRAGFGSSGRKMVRRVAENLPEKSLCMIPSRFAIQMIDSGWILRNDIIWYKPNCMPSSAKDRFTVDYEHIFFFTKSKRYYFKTQYEPIKENSKERYNYNFGGNKKYQKLYGYRQDKGCWKYPNPREYSELGRIKRTVWKIAPKPFPEAHFAVFPEELVRQCIEPGCPPNGVVIDPFMGSGTVPLIALKTDRQFIGIELNKDYIEIAKRRIAPYIEQIKLTSLVSSNDRK